VHACNLGLEGIVSKRRDLPYRSGRSKCWIKLKNPITVNAEQAVVADKVVTGGGKEPA
jgi:ATP-dependent DNA ligase